MDVITIDFETYYADDYTLSKSTTEAYIRDPRFETIMVGVKVNDEATKIYTGENVALALHAYKLHEHAVCMHHSHFDGLILNHHYGIRPKIILDTIPMARAHIGSVAAGGMSLSALSDYFGLPPKGHEVIEAKNKHLSDFTAGELHAYGNYCAGDVDNTKSFCDRLLPYFKLGELKLIDLTTRLFTEPLLEFDLELLEEYKAQVVANKAYLMLRAGVNREDLMSNDKFAEILKRFGVSPGRKLSPTAKNADGTSKTTWAFAKTDPFMKELLEHEDTTISALAEARLGVKTSIAETRAQRYIEMGQRGGACVYLQYWGAEQTGRHSARDKTNFLNMGRNKQLKDYDLTKTATIMTPEGRAVVAAVSKDRTRLMTTAGEAKVKDCHQVGLRDSLRAPEGYSIVVGDSANIEARMLVFLAGQQDVLEKYRRNEDLYCAFGAALFGRPITKADIAERQLAKIAVLGLGYGMGKDKFIDTVRAWDFGDMAEKMKSITADTELLMGAVWVFRDAYDRVKAWWQYCNDIVLPALANKESVYCDPQGLLYTTTNGTIMLPSGRELRYPNLRQERNKETNRTEWVFDVREGRRLVATRIYGGKLVENLVQAAARVVVMDQIVKISGKYRVVLPVYDEAVCCVPDEQAAACNAYIMRCLSESPAWAPSLPVAAETGIGKFYGAAK
jgi:DNA polymerase family A